MPISVQCSDDEFRCSYGTKCINIDYVCDKDDDCDDGSDEIGCPLCESYEHMCASGDECIDIDYVCDLYNDCADGSDEIGCPPGESTVLLTRKL